MLGVGTLGNYTSLVMIFLSTNSRFNFKKTTQLKALPEIQWRNRGKTGGGIMKNKMPSLLLDEKICFIRLLPDTLQNFWQVITGI